jgi:hypothetical protein
VSGTRGVVVCKFCDIEIRMVSVCITLEDKRNELSAGRGDQYTTVPAICWFNLRVLLVNEHKTAQPSSCRTTCHLMKDNPPDKI